MHCIECDKVISTPGLVVAMEQREHFALVRHVEVCQLCAMRVLPFIEKAGEGSKFWHQSLDCVLCGNHFPIARLRFEIKERPSLHVPLCEGCYEKLRPDLLKETPQVITFMEKEWLTIRYKTKSRIPWNVGSSVRVNMKNGKYDGHTGIVVGVRCLQVPWFGYTVRFPDDRTQFFHERDLVHEGESTATPSRGSSAVAKPDAPQPSNPQHVADPLPPPRSVIAPNSLTPSPQVPQPGATSQDKLVKAGTERKMPFPYKPAENAQEKDVPLPPKPVESSGVRDRPRAPAADSPKTPLPRKAAFPYKQQAPSPSKNESTRTPAVQPPPAKTIPIANEPADDGIPEVLPPPPSVLRNDGN